MSRNKAIHVIFSDVIAFAFPLQSCRSKGVTEYMRLVVCSQIVLCVKYLSLGILRDRGQRQAAQL